MLRQAAYALSGLMEDLIHQIDLYYADEIRALIQLRDCEAAEIDETEREIRAQQELDLNDPIPF